MKIKHKEKNIFLHVGHSKTGSSAIQSFLALNTSLLLQHRFDYPAPRAIKAAREGKVTAGNLVTTTPSSWLPAVRKATESSACSNVLFSHEKLFRLILQEPQHLSTAVEKYRTTIILYVRNPLDHFFSSYGQAVKRHGETRELEKRVDSYKYPQMVLDFLYICKDLNASLIVQNYSKIDCIEKNFAKTILGHSAEDFFKSAVRIQHQVNRSMTRGEYELLRQLNRRLGEGGGKIVSDALVDNLPQINSEREYISESSLNKFCDRFEKTIADINGFLGCDQKLELTASIEPTEPSVPYSFSKEQIEAIANSVSSLIEKERKRSFRKTARQLLPATLVNLLRGRALKLP